MSLKILVLPMFIILEVILVIGYIKPAISSILAKQDEMALIESGIANVDATASNIQSLTQSLAGRSEATTFVNRYYPRALDEERVVDMYNFLAQQTGIIVTGVKFTQTQVTHSTEEYYNEAIGKGMTPEQATTHAASAALAVPQVYTAEVAVIGAYQNIKDFLNRVYRTDRLHDTVQFSIGQRKLEQQEKPTKDGDAAAVQNNFLTGTLIAKYPYIGGQKVSDPLTDPHFQVPSIDFDPFSRALTFVTNPLSPLESGSGGRPNPFE